MNKESKFIEIVAYNPEWPAHFAIESNMIKTSLENDCLMIEHIGSTSIPGLSAKPIIDMLLVVSDPRKVINQLENLGYQHRGEYNIPLREYFCKEGGVKVNLHVVPSAHGFIDLNLCFRDYLRINHLERLAYQELKYSLLRDPASFQRVNGMFPRYTLDKDAFIKSVLKKAAFEGNIINCCVHGNEWAAYHRIKEQEIFNPLNIQYDSNHPTIFADHHHHLVLYRGVEIVSIAHVEILNPTEIAIRALATDRPHKNKGYGRIIMSFIERWMKYRGYSVIKLHANLKAENFYRKIGYDNMQFDDVSISCTVVDLGKKL